MSPPFLYPNLIIILIGLYLGVAGSCDAWQKCASTGNIEEDQIEKNHLFLLRNPLALINVTYGTHLTTWYYMIIVVF